MIQNLLARIPNPQEVQGNLGNIGSLVSATQPSSSGAMGGIMDSVQTGFDQLDSAMQGAFDTIKSSLSSSYTPQEVLVPNEGGGMGGGGQQPIMPFNPFGGMNQPQRPPFIDRPGGEFIGSATDAMGISNALPSPDVDFDFSNFLKLQAQQGGPQLLDIMARPATNFGPSYDGMLGNQFDQQMQSLAQGAPTGGIGNAQMGITNLNQDNNIGGASAQQQIDQMISGNAGQYNG